MQLYIIVRTDPYLSVVQHIAPMTLEKAERMEVRLTMCESNPKVRYHAIPYNGA